MKFRKPRKPILRIKPETEKLEPEERYDGEKLEPEERYDEDDHSRTDPLAAAKGVTSIVGVILAILGVILVAMVIAAIRTWPLH